MICCFDGALASVPASPAITFLPFLCGNMLTRTWLPFHIVSTLPANRVSLLNTVAGFSVNSSRTTQRIIANMELFQIAAFSRMKDAAGRRQPARLAAVKAMPDLGTRGQRMDGTFPAVSATT